MHTRRHPQAGARARFQACAPARAQHAQIALLRRRQQAGRSSTRRPGVLQPPVRAHLLRLKADKAAAQRVGGSVVPLQLLVLDPPLAHHLQGGQEGGCAEMFAQSRAQHSRRTSQTVLWLLSLAPSGLPRPRERPHCGFPACAHLPDDKRAVAKHSDARAAQLQGRLQPRNEAGILGLVVGVGVSHVLAEAGHL